MITTTTSSSRRVKPWERFIERFSTLAAELHRRLAGFVGAHVGTRAGEAVIEVGQPLAAVVARAARSERVVAARFALPAMARRVDRRADDAAQLGARDARHRAVAQVVV